MIFSMTGFGKAVVTYKEKKITAEIKSLNSKQLDLSVKLPFVYREKELELRNLVSSELVRGKVDLYITSESNSGAEPIDINLTMLKEYKEKLEQVSEGLSIPKPDDWYATLMRLPNVFKTESDDNIEESEYEALFAAVNEAIGKLKEFRRQEGVRLDEFFTSRIMNIKALLEEIEPYERERVPMIKAKIEDALNKLDNTDYDRNRFEQEMIFYIEKLDVNEEKQRLGNHLNYFLDTLSHGEGQGKKLGFISQEIGREINTLGSKSNHSEMQKIVVKMKDELEQIKEQVLNAL